ncbi:MAG: hypothetical protein LBG57_01770 [Treponema sp.]|jgi:hypothetical protein|nr:hypothetical protein [Treponema sp.]
MGWYSVKKWLFYAAAAYLALAIVGMFTFMSLDASYFEDIADQMTAKNVFLTAVTTSVECPATISATKDRPFSPLRHGSLRIVTPASSFSAGAGLLYAGVRLITKTAAHNIKSTILLKLRI